MDELGAAPPNTDTLAALREECQAVFQIVNQLDESDFGRPTRCPAWNVKELLGHMCRDLFRLEAALDSRPEPPATGDAVSWWRSYDSTPDSEDQRGVAEESKDIAARHASGRALAAAFDELWRSSTDRAAGEDRGRLIVTFGPVLTLEEFLKTRVLELTVHRMDLEDALGRRGWGTDSAVSIVDDILVGLLGTEPPRSLEWDVVDFIDTGTGRRPLTEAETRTLGVRLSKRFPLLR